MITAGLFLNADTTYWPILQWTSTMSAILATLLMRPIQMQSLHMSWSVINVWPADQTWNVCVHLSLQVCNMWHVNFEWFIVMLVWQKCLKKEEKTEALFVSAPVVVDFRTLLHPEDSLDIVTFDSLLSTPVWCIHFGVWSEPARGPYNIRYKLCGKKNIYHFF